MLDLNLNTMLYKRSSSLFKAAQKVLPGGVNSPVRAFKAVGGTPLFIQEAKGAYLKDADGRQLLDYVNSWGPMILGHAYPAVVEAVQRKAEKGTSFGMPTEIETQVAELVVQMVPHIDKIRFVNSGTEACMSAVRLARGFTGKDKIIKFAGCYHGHSDSFLIQAGSGALTFGTPNSPGVTQGTAKDTLLARYNDLDSVQTLIEQHRHEIACIIVEPVAGNMGCIVPQENFLKGLRQLCTANDMLLIFDEVMTGFRLAKGGAQEVYNVQADLVTFGKIIGGGLPVGAFAGSSQLMDHLAPEGPIYQAGTLSGNPLAMAAGFALLKELDEHPEHYTALAEKTAYLNKGMHQLFTTHHIPHQINRVGSMISVHFTPDPVVDFSTATKGNNPLFTQFFHGMLASGIHLPPSAFESWFLSDALSYQDLDYTLEVCEQLAKEMKK